jgi:putative phosphoesterase
MPEFDTIHLGILSDTHIPDRADSLPEEMLTALSQQHLTAILHAGDICSQVVLDQLSTIAPVLAVQGNRDWLYRFKLSRILEPIFNDIKLTLTHGHISIPQYFIDLLHYASNGFTFKRSFINLIKHHPDSKVIIFGHTHRQVYSFFEGVTFLNPGAGYACAFNNFHPQYAVMHISPVGNISVSCYSL